MWRWMVRSTRQSRPAMVAFTTVTMFVLPIGGGMLVMNATNPEADEAKMKYLRSKAGLDAKMVQEVNKKR